MSYKYLTTYAVCVLAITLWCVLSNASPLNINLENNKTCAHYEVSHSNHCYYLDGSGGQCAKGYKRASEAVLKTIATKFKGKTYKSKVSDNCCVWTSNTYENWGMPATSCNVPGTFESGPVLGGSLCTQAQQHFPAQLTFCGSS
ncbi:unnamed protein product [Rotaria sp. Silwood1]|nr:unnamed protein product [Rotaria sp. Silwood1]CAF4060797.1 unnamed protein product [Rotaria sp. Silwood1]CAF4842209.1 unnamed protein product [Rotaria sp. Silwood1]CAF4918806.1 unnamed protein product [Rotaria sp. Silwood1]CAF4919440.1 unnamed protein product [Rotaria sp. Silwood1]